jgi:hypothetical protein
LISYNFSLSELEKTILLVTANDREVPDSEKVNAIAQATYQFDCYDIIMKMIWERLDQKPKNWKIVYKVIFFF